MIFIDAPKHRRLVCLQCGSRNVKVMHDLPAGARDIGISRINGLMAVDAKDLGVRGAMRQTRLITCLYRKLRPVEGTSESRKLVG